MSVSTEPILKREDDLGVAEAFGRDPVLEQRLRDLVARHSIRTVVETGSWRGYTARRFSEFVENVFTIDVDPLMRDVTMATNADRDNVMALRGNSPSVLAGLIPGLPAPMLYYLDAHWNDDWPLLDEIETISRQDAGPAVIVIHDVRVPDTDLGFDSYGGTALTFELVKPLLDKLQWRWMHSFNDETAQGHRRGVLFVEPTM